MNRKIIQSPIFFILSFLLLSGAVTVPSVSAEFYMIAGSRGVGTEIKALPYTISSSGFYYITKNLTCAAGVHGILINADNVTVDLMGFSLIGPGGTGSNYDGISILGRSTVEIRNGTVRGFKRYGIGESSVSGVGHRVFNMRLKNNGSHGVYLLGTSHLVEKCTALENDSSGCYGIYVYSGSTVTGNICYDNGDNGINADEGSTVTANTCYQNSGSGIYAGAGSTVIGNTCRYNTKHGIYLGGDNLVDQNTATNNTISNISWTGSCTFGKNHAPGVP